MRLQRLISVCALSLVALVASTGSDRAEAGDTTRGFHGRGVGVVTEYVTPAHWVIEYVGTAAHLGTYTRTENIYFLGGGLFEGTIVFESVLGEELWVEFEGHFISENDAVATYTFTGGTGRFSEATGTAEAVAYTPDFVNVSVQFDGTINL
jgi:hypothetical protein